MPSCLKEEELPIEQERPPLSGPLRVGTPELYHLASPGRVHSRTVSHSGAEVYEGNSLFGVLVAWKVPSMQLDSQSSITLQSLRSQARKQPGWVISSPCSPGSLGLIWPSCWSYFPVQGVFPGKSDHCKVWEARPTVVRGKKCENASPECVRPFSAVD